MPKKPQKIVIPKGTINPNETTVIEIPGNLRKKSVVIAKKGTDNTTVISESSRRRKT